MCVLFISKDEIRLVFISEYYFLMRKYIFLFLVSGT